jgi:amino acid transporter
VQNGDETDVDCGGSCPPCEPELGQFLVCTENWIIAIIAGVLAAAYLWLFKMFVRHRAKIPKYEKKRHKIMMPSLVAAAVALLVIFVVLCPSLAALVTVIVVLLAMVAGTIFILKKYHKR